MNSADFDSNKGYNNEVQKQLFAQLPFERKLPPMDPKPNSDNDKENGAAFDASFNRPGRVELVRRKRVALRPPTVTTSREFALFMEIKRKEKEKAELDKQQKRRERELKRAQKNSEEKNRKRKIKTPASQGGTKIKM